MATKLPINPEKPVQPKPTLPKRDDGDTTVLDLDYEEDSSAATDSNFVMTGSGGIVEIQGTAEGEPFSQERFLELMGMARKGIDELVTMQKAAIA